MERNDIHIIDLQTVVKIDEAVEVIKITGKGWQEVLSVALKKLSGADRFSG